MRLVEAELPNRNGGKISPSLFPPFWLKISISRLPKSFSGLESSFWAIPSALVIFYIESLRTGVVPVLFSSFINPGFIYVWAQSMFALQIWVVRERSKWVNFDLDVFRYFRTLIFYFCPCLNFFLISIL